MTLALSLAFLGTAEAVNLDFTALVKEEAYADAHCSQGQSDSDMDVSNLGYYLVVSGQGNVRHVIQAARNGTLTLNLGERCKYQTSGDGGADCTMLDWVDEDGDGLPDPLVVAETQSKWQSPSSLVDWLGISHDQRSTVDYFAFPIWDYSDSAPTGGATWLEKGRSIPLDESTLLAGADACDVSTLYLYIHAEGETYASCDGQGGRASAAASWGLEPTEFSVYNTPHLSFDNDGPISCP